MSKPLTTRGALRTAVCLALGTLPWLGLAALLMGCTPEARIDLEGCATACGGWDEVHTCWLDDDGDTNVVCRAVEPTGVAL